MTSAATSYFPTIEVPLPKVFQNSIFKQTFSFATVETDIVLNAQRVASSASCIAFADPDAASRSPRRRLAEAWPDYLTGFLGLFASRFSGGSHNSHDEHERLNQSTRSGARPCRPTGFQWPTIARSYMLYRIHATQNHKRSAEPFPSNQSPGTRTENDRN